jgi:hypothetical protein
MSFLQVKASMLIKEKLRQVHSPICPNRRKIAHTRLEAIAGANNPYSLITILGRGYLAIKSGGAIYVTRCAPVEVIPRSHKNCTEEIPDGEETDEHNLEELKKKYPWWLSGREGKESSTSPEKAEAGDTVTLFKGRNTLV